MYKVFYNDRTVFFVDKNQNLTEQNEVLVHLFTTKKQLKLTLKSFLENINLKSLYVVHNDIEYAFNKFIELYQLIEAAGGFVKNDKNNFLFIYRREIWDLPKGKLEKGETPEVAALREVEEECGIQNLKINHLLEITYHTYKLKDKDILKRTYWFKMHVNGNQKPVPQTEEEITEAKWINTSDFAEILNNTFLSIIEVIKKATL